MIEVYNIVVTRKYNINPESLFVFNRDLTRGHQYKLYKCHTQTNARKYFFTQCVVIQWNKLSQQVVSASTVMNSKIILINSGLETMSYM